MQYLRAALLAFLFYLHSPQANAKDLLGSERVVFQTEFGEFEIGFYDKIAPKTSAHVLKLCQLGAYTSNHFFNVLPNFLVQVEGASTGRTAPVSSLIQEEDKKQMPLEVSEKLRHDAGVVSLARGEDPDTGRSSFAILLNEAPHLDGNYTIFGLVTKGLGVLYEVEDVETTKDSAFQRPMDRVPIYSTYWYTTNEGVSEASCELQ